MAHSRPSSPRQRDWDRTGELDEQREEMPSFYFHFTLFFKNEFHILT